ncbi:MAG: hypothetical protein HZB91_12670 [Elusimicrobia bacterium]|nr:hypothetical protein [Elusimicrobiota bacterium]
MTIAIAAVLTAVALVPCHALAGNVFRPVVRVQAPQPGILWATLPSASLSPMTPGLGSAVLPAALIPGISGPFLAAPEGQPDGKPAIAVLRDWNSEAATGKLVEPAALSSLWDGTLPAAPIDDGIAQPAGGSEPAVLSAPAERLGSERESGTAETVAGSIFDFKPISASPDHGIAPLDRLIRWALTRERKSRLRGFTLSDAASPDQASVFFYGESHSNRRLIEENMRRLASHLKPGRSAIVLDEAYLGPTLFGPDALDYLEMKGLDPEWLGARVDLPGLRVLGWDDPRVYQESSRPIRRHSLAMLELNQHLYGGQRGLRYYAGVASRLWKIYRLWLEMRRLAIENRNAVLDAAVGRAAAEARAVGSTVHVIAGAEHLIEKPWWLEAPISGRVRPRVSMIRALEGTPYWAGMP